MSVVFYSILVTAIFQGFLFGAFLSSFGYDGLLLGVKMLKKDFKLLILK
jgi:hypothetical protein